MEVNLRLRCNHLFLQRLSVLSSAQKVSEYRLHINGPGEAREADIGIAGGAGEAVLFRRGEIIRKIKEENILEELEAEIAKLCQNRA